MIADKHLLLSAIMITICSSNLLQVGDCYAATIIWNSMKSHILFVEDNRQLNTSIRKQLENYYDVIQAKEGHSAVKLAKEIVPDLIISGITLQDMNGIAFCKIIKAQPQTTHIPFIILSAWDVPDLKMQCMESGADYYFSPPLHIDLLLVTIRNIFERDLKLKLKYTEHALTAETKPIPIAKDKPFLKKLWDVIDQNIEDPSLDVDFLCQHLYVSRTKLYQKVKSNSDQSVGELIRKVRLKKAVQLMIYEDMAMNEVVERIGFQSSSNFSRAFKREYGKPPLQFIQHLKKLN